MIQELRDRKGELTDSIQKADWKFEDGSYGEFEVNDGDQERSYHFKRNKDGTITEKSTGQGD